MAYNFCDYSNGRPTFWRSRQYEQSGKNISWVNIKIYFNAKSLPAMASSCL